MRPASIARLVALAGAIAALAAIVGLDRREDGCTDAVARMFVAADAAEAERLDAAVERIEDDCDGSTRLVDSAFVLLLEKDEPARAERLLREAVRREPDSFSGWAGLARVLARTDPAAARAATARARALNPRYRR